MLASITDGAARRFGDRVAVESPEGVLTYAELSSASTRLAGALEGYGVTRGDVVVLAMPSGGDWLVAAVAVNRLGAAYAGLSPVLSPEERSKLVELTGPRLVLADPDLVEGLPLRTKVAVVEPGSRGLGLVGESTPMTGREPVPNGSAAPSTDGPTTTTADPDAPTHASTSPDDDTLPAVVCFTSGTTGLPKAAVYTTRQLRAIQRIDLGDDAEDIWDGGSAMLASTQFAHVGMSTKFPWYLRRGMTLCVMRRWRADEALHLVSRHRMPTIGAIAPQLALMLRSPVIDQVDLDSVQLVIAGGAASPPELVRRVRERLGAGYSIRYSSTESGGVGLATDPSSDDEGEWASVGRPRHGVEVRIADENDHEVPNGEIGELQLRSDATMDRYLNDPVATAAALTPDRWLRTGDLARIDDRGRVVLAGRRSDMYIRGGYNVFPAEVEAVLRNHPGVEDVVVVPAPDEVMGEIGVALVVADPSLTLDELRDFGSRRLARHKLPERMEHIAEVPLTDAQKVDRAAAATLLDRMGPAAHDDG